MRSLIGIVFFIGLALFAAAWMWPVDPPFLQSLPSQSVAMAAFLSSLFATWILPTPRSLLLFPFVAVALWFIASYGGSAFLPAPPPDAGYVCGLPFLGMVMIGLIGIIMSVTGRALGFAVRGKINPVAVYFVQLIPFGAFMSLAMTARP